MDQRDRIAKAMMYSDMPIEGEEPQGLETGPLYGAMPVLSDEARAQIEMALRGGMTPPGYAEGETIPREPGWGTTLDKGVFAPPSIAGEQPPDWFTREPTAPFLNYSRGGYEDT